MRDEGYWSEYGHKQKRSFSSVVLKKGKKEQIYKGKT
jgi:hypothetical protein